MFNHWKVLDDYISYTVREVLEKDSKRNESDVKAQAALLSFRNVPAESAPNIILTQDVTIISDLDVKAIYNMDYKE